MRAVDWVEKLLNRHGLKKPDGRQLYQYRVTDSEFTSLTELLKLSSLMGINNISTMLAWNSCFVIYASEWWRRYYTGQWGWDGVFSSINLDYEDLPVGRRNDLIENGLNRWRREIRIRNGTRQLLGTIATEGGLPLNQLSESGGWLEKILNPVIKKNLAKGLSITTLISNYENVIPQSYRSVEMMEILTDIVESVTYLRQKYQLEEKKNPISWLNGNASDWREKFPLPIDNNVARSLLVELINTAAKEKNNYPQNFFELERYLIRPQSSPEIIAQIDLPEFIPLEILDFEINKDIPTTFRVEVIGNNDISYPWCRGILTTFQERQGFKFFGSNFKLSGNNAIQELSLRFNSVGDIFFERPFVNGLTLDIEQPWLFRNIDDKWSLHSVASSSIKDEEALVYIPAENYNLDDTHGAIEKYSVIHAGHIYCLMGTINISRDDESYKISTETEDSITQYQLSGKRYKNNSSPYEIYIGKPKLQETNKITGISAFPKNMQLQARLIGSNDYWQVLRNIHQGYYEIRLLDNEGNIQLRKRVGILDETFSYKIHPDTSAINKGYISLEGASNYQLEVLGKNISHEIESTSISTKVHLQSDGNLTQYIDIAFRTQQQNRELILSLPYPSRGALLFDSNNNNIPFSTNLYLSNLRGYRIKVVDDRFFAKKQVKIHLSLIDNTIDPISLKDIYIDTPIHLTNQVTELVINDWVEPIETLLGISSSPDSKVSISLTLQGQEQFCLYVRPFESKLIPKHEDGFVELSSDTCQRVSSDDLDKMEVNALLLNQPEQADVILRADESENVRTGKWLFEPNKRSSGSWIIYPANQSSIHFRPVLWSVNLAEKELVIANTWSKAINIRDRKLRENAIQRILQKMAVDLDHTGWDYLKKLWEKTSHLPISTFDIWIISISTPHFMVMILLKNYDDLVEKLEKELPLLWELVPIQAWRKALYLWKDKLSISFHDDKDLIKELLKKKIEKIESLSLSMMGIGKILRIEFLDENINISQGTNKTLRYALNNIESQELHVRKNPDSCKWPELLSAELTDYYNNTPYPYCDFLQPPLDYKKSIIFLPAVLAWDMLSEKNDRFLEGVHTAVEIFKIKQLKDFDEDWFNSVFQYLSVWLYQYFKEEELVYA